MWRSSAISAPRARHNMAGIRSRRPVSSGTGTERSSKPTCSAARPPVGTPDSSHCRVTRGSRNRPWSGAVHPRHDDLDPGQLVAPRERHHRVPTRRWVRSVSHTIRLPVGVLTATRQDEDSSVQAYRHDAHRVEAEAHRRHHRAVCRDGANAAQSSPVVCGPESKWSWRSPAGSRATFGIAWTFERC